MNWQSVVSLGIVVLTAVLMIRGAFSRAAHKGTACEVCMRAHLATSARQIRHRQITT